MRSGLCNDLGVGDATFDKKRAERLRLGDLVPRFDRFNQLWVFPTDGFPKDAVRRLEHVRTPDRNRKNAARSDKAPKPSHGARQIWNEKDTEDTHYGVEGSICEGQVLEVTAAKLDICEAAFSAPLGSFVQEIHGEINR